MDAGFWIMLGAIVALVLCSAFFSASETAVTAASRARLHRLANQGNKRARMVERLREEQDRLIGGILFGNNLVNIVASALATGALVALVGEAGVVYAAAGMTVIVVLFGEVLPKTYAIYRPVRTSLALAPVLRPVIAVLTPVTKAMQAIVVAILRACGVRAVPRLSAASLEEELRGSIDLHGQGKIGESRRMLHSVLDLADYEVGDIMTHRKAAAMIDAGEPAPAIVEKALASPFTRIPLWREKPDNIVGILNTKSLLRGFLAHDGDHAAFDPTAFATPPWFVPDATKLIDQLRAFRDRREHMAMVVDEYGTLMGLITLEDVVEEIVGDIFDEHETALPGVRREPDGSYVVRGTVTVRELNREFNWQLPEEDAATIAGLVIREARIIPEPGQRFAFHDFGFEILRRQRNQITAVRMTPPAAAAPELAA